ncbi:hypothetical protein B0O80DRAFT_265362 [Mortierella sp. GBAus27b]|nr:hypothetical protein B0O80DRAFT_265362 [Mortierella sp. GBAus27b]
MADCSLTIPGELVLALSNRVYYPGRVISFNDKTNKYKIEYSSGHTSSLERNKFFTRYEKGFQTCRLGETTLMEDMEGYQNEELEAEVHKIYPTLYAILGGEKDQVGRVEAFKKGGKARSVLAQRVGPGRFNQAEYTFISNLLQSEFLPDLSTTKAIRQRDRKREPEKDSEIPMKRKGDITRDFSDSKRLQFVMDVLLPETVTRLTMHLQNIDYTQAEQQIRDCERGENDAWWVDDIIAARESFLEGRG